MTKIEFAADKHPDQPGYGMIAVVKGGIRAVGPQNFASEDQAIAAFLRAVGEAVKPPTAS
jgi:hypothetical protein